MHPHRRPCLLHASPPRPQAATHCSHGLACDAENRPSSLHGMPRAGGGARRQGRLFPHALCRQRHRARPANARCARVLFRLCIFFGEARAVALTVTLAFALCAGFATTHRRRRHRQLRRRNGLHRHDTKISPERPRPRHVALSTIPGSHIWNMHIDSSSLRVLFCEDMRQLYVRLGPKCHQMGLRADQRLKGCSSLRVKTSLIHRRPTIDPYFSCSRRGRG